MRRVGSTHRQIIIGIIQTQYDSRNFKSSDGFPLHRYPQPSTAPNEKGRSMTGLLALNTQLS